MRYLSHDKKRTCAPCLKGGKATAAVRWKGSIKYTCICLQSVSKLKEIESELASVQDEKICINRKQCRIVSCLQKNFA